MSNQSSSYTFSSTSSTFSSSTSGQGNQTHTQKFTEQTHSNDQDGTRIHRTAEETGKPRYEEYTSIPAQQAIGSGIADNKRIEDVSDKEQQQRDRLYEERMEDEYAKREGGA